MLADPEQIRRRASGLRDQAETIRTQARRLVGAAATVTWDGWSAEAMRDRAAQGAQRLLRSADAHEEAAAALDRHAAAVERTLVAIARAERRIRGLIADAGEAARDLWDGLDLPESGDLAWLDFRLPLPGGAS